MGILGEKMCPACGEDGVVHRGDEHGFRCTKCMAEWKDINAWIRACYARESRIELERRAKKRREKHG